MPRKEAAPAAAPEWVLTYGDMMSLLLVFFVALVSMSEIKPDRFQQAAESLRHAFGGYEGSVGQIPEELPTRSTLIASLMELGLPVNTDKRGDSPDEGAEDRKMRVTTVRDELHMVLGGSIAFDRFSAELKPEGRELVAKTADLLRGCNTRILVRAHATQEPLPPDAAFDDPRDLSYARAKAVLNELEAGGVRGVQLIPIAMGDSEPCVRQADTEERRALNRRVEIVVTEDLVEDFAGKLPAGEGGSSYDDN